MAGADAARDRRWRRRLLTVPTVWLVGLFCLTTMPLWLPVVALVDLLRRPPRVAVRCGLFLTWFALCEMFGMLGYAFVSISTIGRLELATARFYILQRLWSRALLGGGRRIFGFRFAVEGHDAAAATPLLLFM